MDKEILRFESVTKRFGRKEALSEVSFSLKAGRITGLLGPNGSGKTTLIKLANGLLQPDQGTIRINDRFPGVETKAEVSYLPDRMYFADWMKVRDLMKMFSDFYRDFSISKAEDMMQKLSITSGDRIKNMSKGTKEKLQLILVMSREAKLYLLDEPIGGVDPAARDFILKTIITNYSPDSAVLISTHLIADVEKVLDDVIILKKGRIHRQESVDHIREEEGRSVDQLFRETFSET